MNSGMGAPTQRDTVQRRLRTSILPSRQMDILRRTAPGSSAMHLSFEFFPPKTDEQRVQLDKAAAKFRAFAPEYVSVTFGAGGSTLSYTPETVQRLHDVHGFDAAPHVSCMG